MGAFLSPDSNTKVNTTNRNVTGADQAVQITPNVTAGKNSTAIQVAGNYFKDAGNTTVERGGTLTTNVSNGLSAEQLHGIVGDFGASIRNVLTQAATSNSSNPSQAANDRAADQITNAPAAAAAEAKSYKWLVVGLIIIALVVGAFITTKGKK